LTYATYETLCRLHIIPELGKKRIDKLSPRDVQVWLNQMQVKCQCCTQELDAKRPENKRRCCAVGKCCQKRLGARSIKDLKTVLRSALSHAVRDELATRNAAESTTLPAMRSKKRKAWTSEEARRFLESAREAGDPLYAAFVLILVLGFRKGEVLGLAWDEVDLDNRRLMIEWQVQRVGRELLRRQTKTEASDAGLPLPEICITALRERQIRQGEQRAAAGRGWEAVENLVFTRDCGSPVEPRTFNRQFSARCRKAGVKTITVHDARRTCATLLVDLDVHPRIVMEILRHAQIEVTMEIYAQASSPATQEALRRLGEQLSSPNPEREIDDDQESA
jgi:integrase